MLTVGFTGTREGMTDAQKKQVSTLLHNWIEKQDDIVIARQGCCVGSDEDFTIICSQIGFPAIAIVGHPPILPTYYSNKAKLLSHYMKRPMSYLSRDRSIVNSSTRLIATPLQPEPQFNASGGTWYTINFARRNKMMPIYIVYPDGKVEGL
jgi:hypothetical protein